MAPWARTPMSAIAAAHASVTFMPPVSPPEPLPTRPTSIASRSPASASALPLFDAGNGVWATVNTSPLAGTPARLSSKPFSAIGCPATHVPVPLDTSALVVRSRSSQL